MTLIRKDLAEGTEQRTSSEANQRGFDEEIGRLAKLLNMPVDDVIRELRRGQEYHTIAAVYAMS